MKKVASTIGFAILILLMLTGVLTFLAPRFGYRVDAVLSGSMEPALKLGSVVVSAPVKAEEVEVGDIIIFRSPGEESRLIGHRVIKIETGYPLRFQTKGDANEDAEPFLVPAENVVGRVVFQLPYFGYVANFIKTKTGFLLTLFVPGLIIILMEMRNIWHALSEMEEN